MTGVYLLIFRKKIVYVGATRNYPNRIKQHKDKKFNAHTFISCTETRLASLEREMIKTHKPKYNKSLGAGVVGKSLVEPSEKVILVGFYTKKKFVDAKGGIYKVREKCKQLIEA